MGLFRRRLHWTIPAIAALVGLAGLAPPVAAAPPPGKGKPITVMTRNVYLGGDIGRPLRLVQGVPPAQQLAAFIAANTTLRAIVDQTNFPLRSKQLAREIAVRRPQLVGLQEMALWRHGPLGSTAT